MTVSVFRPIDKGNLQNVWDQRDDEASRMDPVTIAREVRQAVERRVEQA